jgi:methylmalonyl-CoA mutase N-terminal domain/subunit
MVRALERGYVQQEIQNAAYEYQRQVDQGNAIVVGLNQFTMEAEEPIPIQRIDESLESKQVERLRKLRGRRNQKKWSAALREVEIAAQSRKNLMPFILQAVESFATVGEISDTLRGVFGEYHETVVV